MLWLQATAGGLCGGSCHWEQTRSKWFVASVLWLFVIVRRFVKFFLFLLDASVHFCVWSAALCCSSFELNVGLVCCDLVRFSFKSMWFFIEVNSISVSAPHKNKHFPASVFPSATTKPSLDPINPKPLHWDHRTLAFASPQPHRSL